MIWRALTVVVSCTIRSNPAMLLAMTLKGFVSLIKLVLAMYFQETSSLTD